MQDNKKKNSVLIINKSGTNSCVIDGGMME